jgi:hypothetical protein
MWKNPSYGPVDLEIEVLAGVGLKQGPLPESSPSGVLGAMSFSLGELEVSDGYFLCASYWDPVLTQHFPMAEGPSGLQAPIPAAAGRHAQEKKTPSQDAFCLHLHC